jgi:hypothetical protein
MGKNRRPNGAKAPRALTASTPITTTLEQPLSDVTRLATIIMPLHAPVPIIVSSPNATNATINPSFFIAPPPTQPTTIITAASPEQRASPSSSSSSSSADSRFSAQQMHDYELHLNSEPDKETFYNTFVRKLDSNSKIVSRAVFNNYVAVKSGRDRS